MAPRRKLRPRRDHQAKVQAMQKWRRENEFRAVERCSTVFPSGTRCRGTAVREGYCARCWDGPPTTT